MNKKTKQRTFHFFHNYSPPYFFFIFLSSLALVLFGSGALNLSLEKQHETNSDQFYPVLSVTSSSTFRIKVDDQFQTVRMIGVGTPNYSAKTGRGDCFGLESYNRAYDLLANAHVRLVPDRRLGDRDANNRVWRYVYLEDGTFLNEYLIADGYAKEFGYGSIPYLYQNQFQQVEKVAKEEGRGLWSKQICPR